MMYFFPQILMNSQSMSKFKNKIKHELSSFVYIFFAHNRERFLQFHEGLSQ